VVKKEGGFTQFHSAFPALLLVCAHASSAPKPRPHTSALLIPSRLCSRPCSLPTLARTPSPSTPNEARSPPVPRLRGVCFQLGSHVIMVIAASMALHVHFLVFHMHATAIHRRPFNRCARLHHTCTSSFIRESRTVSAATTRHMREVVRLPCQHSARNSPRD